MMYIPPEYIIPDKITIKIINKLREKDYNENYK